MPKRQLPLPHIYNNIKYRRTSPSACRGSITVEAAMAVPVFFFAVLALIYLMEMMAVQTSVRSGLQDAGKQMQTEAIELSLVVPSNVEADIVNSIGAERLDRSIVVGGSGGIDCSRSYLSPASGIGVLSARYEMQVPVPVFRSLTVVREEKMKFKAWTGYEGNDFGGQDDEIVYVTETGMVYHKNYHCSYLDLSIHAATAGEVERLRNENGGKYHACEKCVRGAGMQGVIYITNQGDRYHNSLSCSGLKRTIYTAHISELPGKGACSKCGR